MNILDLKFSSINAKLKAMRAKKLTKKEDFYKLIKQNDFKSAVFTLKEEFEILKDLKEDSDRIAIEQELDKITIEDIKKIYRLLEKKEKKVFMIFISKFEADCLKSVIKSLTNKIDMNKKLENVNLWTSIVFRKIHGIAKVNTINEFLYKSSKSLYYDTLSQYFSEQEDINKISIFKIESLLDKTYFEILYKESKKINKDLEELIRKKNRFIKYNLDI